MDTTVIAVIVGVVIVAVVIILMRGKGSPKIALDDADSLDSPSTPASADKPATKKPRADLSSLPSLRTAEEAAEEENDITTITLSPAADKDKPLPSLSKASYDDDDEDNVVVANIAATPIVIDDNAGDDEPTRTSPFFLVSASGQTDRGKRRKFNEDSFLVLDEQGLYVVADGMGGYAGGEVASALTVELIEQAFTTQKFDGPTYNNVPKRGAEVARAIQTANKTIYEKAQTDPMLKGMGTTVVAARFMLNKQRLYLGHVGDSRCYRLRDGKLDQITTDHTMAALGFKGAAFAHRLHRAVGTTPGVEIDLIMGRPRANDVYLLCSDGLSKMINDAELCRCLMDMKDPQTTVDSMIKLANDNGGHDNITVIIVCVLPATEYIKSLGDKRA
ncbi:MAG TPA: protein phosphatase 2C domain-containing protein [Polyangium sp.]|nr:protein phosphatase 2C domain-containing protein [Polyangium sp.]